MRIPRPIRRLLLLFAGCIPLSAGYVYQSFDYPGVPNGTAGIAINNSGQIVGFYEPSSFSHGFLQNSDGTFVSIDEPNAFPVLWGTQPWGINANGVIVGTYYNGTAPFNYGFVRDGLGNFSSFAVASATGINDSGQVTGNTTEASAYLRSSDGSTFTAFAYPGASGTLAQGINNAGQIVGFYYYASGTHSFLRNPDGTMSSFDFPGITGFNGYAEALGINNNDQIVGFVYNGVTDFGFVRASDGSYTSLDFPGALDTFASGINDSGEIVGFYYDSSGGRHGFTATDTPEPGTLLLVGIGLSLTAVRLASPSVIQGVARRKAQGCVSPNISQD